MHPSIPPDPLGIDERYRIYSPTRGWWHGVYWYADSGRAMRIYGDGGAANELDRLQCADAVLVRADGSVACDEEPASEPVQMELF